MNDKLAKNIDKINKFTLLSEGEYFGLDIELSKKVISLLKSLKQQPEIFIIGDGSIQLEYGNSQSGNYLEFCITPENKMDVYKVKNGVKHEECGAVFDLNHIEEEIKCFINN